MRATQIETGIPVAGASSGNECVAWDRDPLPLLLKNN